jgi:hypothetical protein
MRSLTDFAIRQEYERIKELGDKLVDIGNSINWEGFRPKLEEDSYLLTLERDFPRTIPIFMLISSIILNFPLFRSHFDSYR